MRIHYLQHVDFEDTANIKLWAEKNNYPISYTKLYEGEEFPDVDEFDLLVIMGGPMNIYEESLYPWLKEEKIFIKKAIKENKAILGICLGAQLLADILGAKVYKNAKKEIGWFNIKFSEEAKNSGYTKGLQDDILALHWHGDTFEIPEGAIPLASSEACKNQGFIYNNRVIGLQFHLETSAESLNKLINNCKNELINGDYIQSEEEMISNKENFNVLEKNMLIFLENLTKICQL